ncbi:MAG: NADPH-dependent FMN reductase [Hyphomicrobiales bacterium]|nr:MAG: NADPH-dependent FMN reductase [Hyphomicrobiales bacterium]
MANGVQAEVAIVFHSGYGHTRVQAEAVRQGIDDVEGVTAHFIPVEEVDDKFELLETVDGIIFGAPTYMGSASAPFKEFMDKSSKVWFEQKWKDKLAAGFTNSGSQSGDKLSTLNQFAIFAAQHGMNWINLGLMPGNNSSKGSPEDLNRIGGYIGAMAQSDVDVGADVAPPLADRKTAQHLGKRVAESALRWKAGASAVKAD